MTRTYFLQLFSHRVTVARALRLPVTVSHTIQALGVDGMSSEISELDTEGHKQRHNVHVLPWRNATLTNWLHKLDAASMDNLPNGKSLPGRKWQRDRYFGDQVSSRSPPQGLPEAFFEPMWLAEQRSIRLERLKVDAIDLPLPEWGN